MCCKKNVLTIIGMLTRIEVYQIPGKDSRSSLCWKRNLKRDMCGPGGDWQKFKRPLDLRICGLKFGPKWEKPLRRKKTKNGQTRSQNSTMLEDWEAFISSIRKMVKKKRNHQKYEKKMGSFKGCGYHMQERNKETMLASGNWNLKLWIQQDSKNKACMCRGGTWVHETTSGIISTEKWRRSHRRQRTQFDESL